MKLTINPRNLFRSKKTRSDPSSSFSSGSSSSCDDSTTMRRKKGKETPDTVLPNSGDDVAMYFELVQAFKLIDKDGDGKITREELEAVLTRLGGAHPLTDDELAMMLTEVDRDGDGCISLEEFGAVSSAFGPPSCDSELKDAFDFFDMDHDGKITAEELYSVFTSIGDDRCTLEDCRGMIKGVDAKGDGFVCFEDFVIMMEHQR